MATSGAILLVFFFLFPISFTGLYSWKREMWMGIVSGIAWLCMGIYLMLNVSASSSFMQISDVWMALSWLCMALAMVFALSPFVWKKHEIAWEEETDEYTGEPIMVMFKDGNKTGQERDLTDAEIKGREQRIKEERETRVQSRRESRSSRSSFGDTGKI